MPDILSFKSAEIKIYFARIFFLTEKIKDIVLERGLINSKTHQILQTKSFQSQ